MKKLLRIFISFILFYSFSIVGKSQFKKKNAPYSRFLILKTHTFNRLSQRHLFCQVVYKKLQTILVKHIFFLQVFKLHHYPHPLIHQKLKMWNSPDLFVIIVICSMNIKVVFWKIVFCSTENLKISVCLLNKVSSLQHKHLTNTILRRNSLLYQTDTSFQYFFKNRQFAKKCILAEQSV